MRESTRSRPSLGAREAGEDHQRADHLDHLVHAARLVAREPGW